MAVTLKNDASIKFSTDFDSRVSTGRIRGLFAAPALKTIQVNIGLICNLTCTHCHVNSSPKRTEEMDWPTMERILKLADDLNVQTIDITGGAPEMNPHFERFITEIRSKDFAVIARTNLTILLEPDYAHLIDFYKKHHVELVASLPCYTEENVDKQRGEGVFHESIEVIQSLNAIGYGTSPELTLHLVYNPGGPSLPPDQATLEDDYHRELDDRFGIKFTHLHTITNVPIGRFKTDLRRDKQLDTYMDTLRNAFNPDAVEPLMCRHQISVAWDGTLYDCDFNLALRMPIPSKNLPNINNIDPQSLQNRRIATGNHCYACTAGAGSSCGGALI
ncbi:MAG: arsenosugar biosynthesis radical SAM (seleno)protein ArsS [Candidatus Hydrogenedentota bacterium]